MMASFFTSIDQTSSGTDEIQVKVESLLTTLEHITSLEQIVDSCTIETGPENFLKVSLNWTQEMSVGANMTSMMS